MTPEDEYTVSFSQISDFGKKYLLIFIVGGAVGALISGSYYFLKVKSYSYSFAVSGEDNLDTVSSSSIKIKRQLFASMFSNPKYSGFFARSFFEYIENANKKDLLELLHDIKVITDHNFTGNTSNKKVKAEELFAFYLLTKISNINPEIKIPFDIDLEENNRWVFEYELKYDKLNDLIDLTYYCIKALKGTLDFYNDSEKTFLEGRREAMYKNAVKKYSDLNKNQDVFLSDYQEKMDKLELEINRLEIEVLNTLQAHNVRLKDLKLPTMQISSSTSYLQTEQITSLKLSRINWYFSHLPINSLPKKLYDELASKLLNISTVTRTLLMEYLPYIETPANVGKAIHNYISDLVVPIDTTNFALPAIDDANVSRNSIIVLKYDKTNRHFMFIFAGLFIGIIGTLLACIFHCVFTSKNLTSVSRPTSD